MKADPMGFLYPEIDKELCTGCGACERACTFRGKAVTNGTRPIAAYAVRHSDDREIDRSQSGGAFAALSDSVLSEGGVVYGAGYGEGLYVRHSRAVTASGRDKFRGSKYVQSDMGDIYSAIREDLRDGLTVLFTGTPCQTAAVREITGKLPSGKLILVDLICHGVASPQMWSDYLHYLERRHGGEIVSAKFRDKKFGWHSHRESFTFSDGRTLYPQFLVYAPMFMRPSCGGCKYSTLVRCGDITIGDYWGVEKVFPDFETENRGCSLMLCNTPTGLFLMEKVKPMVAWREVEDMADVLQPNLTEGTRLPERHGEFAQYYSEHGFRKAMAHFDYLGWRSRLRRFFRHLRRRIKNILTK